MNDLEYQIAKEEASALAMSAGVHMKMLTSDDEILAFMDLGSAVWKTPTDDELVSLTRALAHAGNYISGAYVANNLVGIGFGFLGFQHGVIHLHSHSLGVDKRFRNMGIGRAIKLHQKAWAIERNIFTITWTFDPLERRNAFLNLNKLGGSITDYLPNFYGHISEGINANDETDRCLLTWNLKNDLPVQANDFMPTEEAIVLSCNENNMPELHSKTQDFNSALYAQIPDDIVTLRASDPETALHWRKALRSVMEPALRTGYLVSRISKDGWYELKMFNK